MNIGQRLKYARRCRKVTQSELSESIGVSRGVITNIELNKVETPQSIVITALCNALKIDSDWLVYGRGDMDAHIGKLAEDSDMSEELYHAIDGLRAEEQVLLLQIIRLITLKPDHMYSKRYNPEEQGT